LSRLRDLGAWISGVCGHLSKRETVAPALIALLVSAVASPVATGLMNQYNARLHARDEAKHQAISHFELEADAFGPFATVFVLGLSRDNKVDPQAFERLSSNIVSQKTALDALQWRLSPDLLKKAQAYEKALLAVNAVLGKVTSVEDMREFWERTSDLLVIRQDFLPRLEADSV
jgi:hypothetical protein